MIHKQIEIDLKLRNKPVEYLRVRHLKYDLLRRQSHRNILYDIRPPRPDILINPPLSIIILSTLTSIILLSILPTLDVSLVPVSSNGPNSLSSPAPDRLPAPASPSAPPHEHSPASLIESSPGNNRNHAEHSTLSNPSSLHLRRYPFTAASSSLCV